jgi:hypothetical protein
MGHCQGRMCSHLLTQLVGRETGRSPAAMKPLNARPPIFPVPLGALGREPAGAEPIETGEVA